MAVDDGGASFILISPLPLPEGCEPQIVDGLLCPSLRDGYPSRLFLSAKITHKGPGQNWNPQTSVLIAGRQWWAVSWHTHNDNQRLLGIVTAHLQAFQCKRS
jgi:hypothetical protein